MKKRKDSHFCPHARGDDISDRREDAGAALAGTAHASAVNGTIDKIDGDKDGQADDVRISQFTFDVTAGTTVFFDSLACEATNVDLNGDGAITGFDVNMWLFKGTTLLRGFAANIKFL